MLEQQIFKTLLVKDIYDKYRDVAHLSDGLRPWLATVDAWFENHDASISLEDVYQLHIARHPVATSGQRSLMETTFNLLKDTEVNPEVIEELLLVKKQQEQYMHWAERLVKLGETRGSPEDFLTIKEEMEKFDAFVITGQEFPPLNITADEMLEACVKQGKWKFNLPIIQEKTGGIGPGVFALTGARPNCFSADTQILTDAGWKYFYNIEDDDLVYQVEEDGKGTFVKPTAKVSFDTSESLLSIQDSRGRCDMLVTKDHDVVIRRKNTRQFEKVSALSFKPSGNTSHVMAAPIAAEGRGLTPFERFLIAYQADGSGPRKGCTGARGHVSVAFNFSKERKKVRLRNILNDTGLIWKEFTGWKNRENYSTFYVQLPETPSKTFAWVDLCSIGTIWAREFIEELSYWDATRRKEGRIKYDTKEQLNADVVQAVSVLAGYRSIIKKKNPYKPHHSFNYSMHILPHLDNIETRNFTKTETQYKGVVYCVTVPSGKILVRREGLPFVSGNCGKSLFCISSAFGPGGWLEQGAKVVYLGNEEAIHRTKHRAICAYSGMENKQTKLSPEDFKLNVLKFDENFKEKAIFIHRAGLPYYDVEKLIKEHTPDILIIDQIDKLQVKGDAPMHEKTRVVYTTMREYSVSHNLAIIGVCQASEAAHGKKFFGFDALEHSKTGKAAELDLCICIGKEALEEDNNVRYFYLAKNKLTGDVSTGSFTIDKERSRLEV